MVEKFDIVDKEDNVIKTGVTEDKLHLNNDITRVVTAYIFNNDGKIIIAQRAKTKKIDPLKFEAPAHGRVSSGETYIEALKREIKEELNVETTSLIKIEKYYFNFMSNLGLRQHQCEFYLGFTNQEIIYDKEEINSLKEFETFDSLKKYYEENKEIFSLAQKNNIEKLTTFFSKKENVINVQNILNKK
jgi:isopentenyldiphosphate isomerase